MTKFELTLIISFISAVALAIILGILSEQYGETESSHYCVIKACYANDAYLRPYIDSCFKDSMFTCSEYDQIEKRKTKHYEDEAAGKNKPELRNIALRFCDSIRALK